MKESKKHIRSTSMRGNMALTVVENKNKDDRILEYFSPFVTGLILYNKKKLMQEERHIESHQKICILILIYNI
jgi:hypothetical protein|tara:strand:- start:12311 stop:12529 length:219 start_codon:yes stop_codon:yes gene_type:complete